MVAKEYKEKRSEFDKNAKQWTQEFANPEKMKTEKIKKITEMGFTDEQAIEALERVGWDETEAIQALLS